MLDEAMFEALQDEEMQKRQEEEKVIISEEMQNNADESDEIRFWNFEEISTRNHSTSSLPPPNLKTRTNSILHLPKMPKLQTSITIAPINTHTSERKRSLEIEPEKYNNKRLMIKKPAPTTLS
ncbi:9230_t:CDS:2, partial [Ambispora leptoticha]